MTHAPLPGANQFELYAEKTVDRGSGAPLVLVRVGVLRSHASSLELHERKPAPGDCDGRSVSGVREVKRFAPLGAAISSPLDGHFGGAWLPNDLSPIFPVSFGARLPGDGARSVFSFFAFQDFLKDANPSRLFGDPFGSKLRGIDLVDELKRCGVIAIKPFCGPLVDRQAFAGLVQVIGQNTAFDFKENAFVLSRQGKSGQGNRENAEDCHVFHFNSPVQRLRVGCGATKQQNKDDQKHKKNKHGKISLVVCGRGSLAEAFAAVNSFEVAA
jgi:hypothetical protein